MCVILSFRAPCLCTRRTTHAASRVERIGEADRIGRFIGDMPQEASHSVDAPGAIPSEQAIVDFT